VRPPSPQRPSPAYGSLPPLPRGLALYPVDPLPANLYHRDTPPLLASAEGVGDRGFGMGSLEDLGSVGHALSALSYGRDTAACCAAEIAVHACEHVSQSTQGELVLFLMAAPASGRSAVVLYGGQHAQQCDDSEQNNIATGMRLIMGSLRTAAAPPDLDPTGASLTRPASPIAADLSVESPRGGASGAAGTAPSSGSSTPRGDLADLQRAGGPARSPLSRPPRRSAASLQLPPTAPAAVTPRPMACFPGLLTFSPMVGADFVIDPATLAGIESDHLITVPRHLSVSLLGRLRARFSSDRPLCKLFLKLIRHAVSEFLKQLPAGSRSSVSANKYESMTPASVSKVTVAYQDGDRMRTAVAPMLTNTSGVDTVKFLGLVCYMVHVKDAAYMWLVEEFCAGAEVPTISKAKPRSRTGALPASGTSGSGTALTAVAAGGGDSAAESGGRGAGAAPPRPAAGGGDATAESGGRGAGAAPPPPVAGGGDLAAESDARGAGAAPPRPAAGGGDSTAESGGREAGAAPPPVAGGGDSAAELGRPGADAATPAAAPGSGDSAAESGGRRASAAPGLAPAAGGGGGSTVQAEGRGASGAPGLIAAGGNHSAGQSGARAAGGAPAPAAAGCGGLAAESGGRGAGAAPAPAPTGGGASAAASSGRGAGGVPALIAAGYDHLAGQSGARAAGAALALAPAGGGGSATESGVRGGGAAAAPAPAGGRHSAGQSGARWAGAVPAPAAIGGGASTAETCGRGASGAQAPAAVGADRSVTHTGGLGEGAALALVAAGGGGLAAQAGGRGAIRAPAAAAAGGGGSMGSGGSRLVVALASGESIGGTAAAERGLAPLDGQVRSQLLQGGTVVASCFLLPLRSHRGRVAVARNQLVVGDVVVVEGHERDNYGFDVDLGGGRQTLGAATVSGTAVVWPASEIG